jgi:hypothetical protein
VKWLFVILRDPAAAKLATLLLLPLQVQDQAEPSWLKFGIEPGSKVTPDPTVQGL